MKILKPGVMYPQIVFNCPRCECIFLADEDDKILDSRDGDYVICPTCNRTIDWRFGESQKKQQEKQKQNENTDQS